MKCSYCGKEIEPGTGIMFVRKNGTIRYYCSNRCYKFDVVYRKKARAEKQKRGRSAAKAVSEAMASAGSANKPA